MAQRLAEPSRMIVAISLAGFFTLLGMVAGNTVVRESGIKDPGFFVLDEVAGQMIALIAVPLEWKNLLASFILFRAFDILKPFPVRRLESWPEGTGVMMDDVAAGVYALAAVHLLFYFF
jgi:phosphatidylglycerophosphatase A